MKKSQTELTYLRGAAQNATSVGLVIILYDLLIRDLEQAIAAFAEHDIERRTAEIKHAFVILQQLQGSLDMENGAEAAANLSGFYSALRGKIFEAHTKADPAILRQQIGFVIDVRQAWQQVDKPNLGPADGADELVAARREAAATGEEAVSVSWTA